MNILNSIKKYFKLKTDAEKQIFSLTSADNVLDKNTKFYIDERIDALKRYCDTLSNFVEPQIYQMPENSRVSNNPNLINVVILGKLCLITGVVYLTTGGGGLPTGSTEIDLPLNLKPQSNECHTNNKMRIDGTEYNVQFMVTRNKPSKLLIYCNPSIPEGKTLPINLIFPLDQNVR